MPANKAALQLCTSLLKLMLYLVERVSLADANYESFEQWLVDLAKLDVSKEHDIAETIAKLLLTVTTKSYSPVHSVKSIASEQLAINAPHVITCLRSGPPLYNTQTKMLKFIGLTQQFKFLTPSNSYAIHAITYECLTSWFASVRWCIDHRVYFEADALLEAICRQLHTTVLALNNLLVSVSCVRASNLVLSLFSHFYALITHLFGSDLVTQLTSRDTLSMLKSLVDSVYANFNCKKIQVDLNRIQEIRGTSVSDQNSNGIEHLVCSIQCKDEFHSCIDSIDAFEKCLLDFSKRHAGMGQVNFMEKYKSFITGLELCFKTGSVKRVTRDQICEC